MSAEAENLPSRRECSVCSRSLKTDAPECSASCNLAARIPLGDAALPASWELFGALASGFVIFNQLLFWNLSVIERNQSDAELGASFDAASLAVGGIWLVAALWAWGVSRPKGTGDYLTAAAVVLVLILPRFAFDRELGFSTLFLVVNLLIAGRLYRGMYCLWRTSKKREK